MQRKRQSDWERRLAIIGIPLFMLAWYMGNQIYSRPFSLQVARTMFSILLMVSVQWLLIYRVMILFRKRYPHYKKTLIRIFFSIMLSGIFGMVLGYLVAEGPALLLQQRAWSWMQLGLQFGPWFFFSALVVGSHEVIYNFYELRRLDQEKEALKRAHLQSQIDSLKSQVNPHFLFNALNTAISLISISPDRAEQFLTDLSSVYRYLLQSGTSQLSTLQQELRFIQSYFHLLKTRFGEAIVINIAVTEYEEELSLPSLTLQLLVENAVKHNIVSMIQPLHITISTQTDGDKLYLCIQNNLQRKVRSVQSNKVGLHNIISNYKLLNREDVTISDENNCFTVVVPLLKHSLVSSELISS